MFALKRGQNWK